MQYNSGIIKQHALDGELGSRLSEFTRVGAVYKCMEYLAMRGWQCGESDAKCVYDVFAYKDSRTITIQVKSSSRLSRRGWPEFSVRRLKFNTKVCQRMHYNVGDFDYWCFYAANGDAWMMPFSAIDHTSMITMEGLDEYYLG